ncbi:MAG: hypothetical protein KBA31_19000 [Alphaproteobacteria bacterium]|nr:hypothetical protein [Alphaproteobacteria bacterium]
MAWYLEIPVGTGEAVVREVIDFSENVRATSVTRTRSWWPGHFMTGRKLDIGPVWLRIKLGKPYTAVPDVLPIHGPWMVSETFRKIVEEREPDTHQFFPVELQIAKGGAELGPRYILNVGQTLNAISVNHSKINWGVRADGSKWAYPPGADDDLVVTKTVVHGKSLWSDRLYPANSLISDGIKIAFESAQVLGLRYVRVREQD